MIRKRKKNTRLRGSGTHGYGSMKKHRGQGHRGGRGNSGSGKRADTKKPTMLKNKRQFGKHGFISRSRTVVVPVNLRYIDERADSFIKSGKAKEFGGIIHINLLDIGCDKLLGKGAVKRKYKIECSIAAPGAIKAVEAAGGTVIAKEVSGSKAGKLSKGKTGKVKADVTEDESQ